MSDFARFWRLLVLVQQPLAVISPRGREGDNMLPVIFFLFNPNSRFFSPGFLWLSLLLIRGVRHVEEGGGGGGSWESNYSSLFLPQTFFLSSTRVLWADGREGGWAAEICTRTQTQMWTWCPGTGGHSFRQAFLAQMTGIHIWRSEFSISHFRP